MAGFRDNETKLIYFKELRKRRGVKKVRANHSDPIASTGTGAGSRSAARLIGPAGSGARKLYEKKEMQSLSAGFPGAVRLLRDEYRNGSRML